jgi:PQQ-dependent catabolism-associated CXXCW motif protein
MPGAGDGALDPARERLLAARVETLTAGARNKPVVAFCHRDCWASWNAAKRLVRSGYSRVYWFPDGVEGWQDAYEAAVVQQDPAWAAGRRAAP